MVKVFKPIQIFKESQITKIQKQDFFPGLIKNGIRILKRATANNSVGTIYTVPSGKTFFMIYCSASIRTTTGVIGSANLRINGDNTQRIIDIPVAAVDNQARTNNISFSIPLIFMSGDKIEIESGQATNFSSAEIVGYEIDNTLIPNFI